MDILTPKGQETLGQERMAIRLFTESFPGFDFIETPKDRPADIDGFVVQLHPGNSTGTLICGVEVKCRNMTVDQLRGEYNNRWLVTADKIDRGVAICKGLGIDFRGFLYLVPNKMLLIVPIWSYEKGYVADIEYEQTQTQATVNGGLAMRLNAYIDTGKAKVVAEG